MTATSILWQPTPSEIEKSELSNFANWVKSHHGFDWRNKYRNLWLWSVEYPDLFWDSIWQWHGVIGRKGKRLLINRDKISEIKACEIINFQLRMLKFGNQTQSHIFL